MYLTRNFRFVAAVLFVAVVARPAIADTAQEKYALAAGYYNQARWQEAVDGFESFLADHPEHASAIVAQFFMGESLVQLGKYSDAYTSFRGFFEKNPDHKYGRQALYRAGETAYLAGDNQNAKVHLEQFHEKFQEDLHLAFVIPYLGEIALREKNIERADTLYREAIERFPSWYKAASDDRKTMEALVRQADVCRYGLARVLESRGQFEEAENLYQILAQREGSQLADDAVLQRAMLQYNRGQYDQTIESLTDFDTKFKDSNLTTPARYWLGMAHLSGASYEEAVKTLQEAAEDNPRHHFAPAIEFATGVALHKQGMAEPAKEYFRHVAKQWSASDWGDDSLEMLVRIALQEGDHNAVDSLTSTFEESYGQSQLRDAVDLLHGRSLLKREKYPEAIALFEQLSSSRDGEADKSDLHYLLGLSYIGTSKFEDAFNALNQVQPNGVQKELLASVQLARATSLIGMNRHQEAVAAQRQYLAILPEGPEAAKCRADLIASLTELKMFDDAFAVQQELKVKHVGDALLLPTTYFLAERAYKNNQTAIAKKLFQELAADGNPSEFVQKGLYGLAWIESAMDDPNKSATAFEQLLKANPDSALAAEAAFMRAKSLEKSGQVSAATDAYELITQKYSKSEFGSEALLKTGQLYASRESREEKEKAIGFFTRLLAEFTKDPHLDAALYDLGWLYIEVDRPTDSMAAFARIHDEFRESPYWGDVTYRLAEKAVHSGDRERARELADELVGSSVEGDVLCHSLYLRGQLAAHENDWQIAADLMHRVVNEFPDSTLRLAAAYWVAESYYRRNDFGNARANFDSLAEETKDNTEAWTAMIPLRQAQILAQQKKWPEAIELVSGIAERFPNFDQQYEVDYLLGRGFASQAKFTEAREAYERVVRSTTGGRTKTAAMAQWMIGESYFHQKNYDQAIKAYHRVETLYAFPQWQANSMLQAGKCYEKKGDWETAIKLYAQLLKNYADTPFAEEASQRLRYAQDKLTSVPTQDKRR